MDGFETEGYELGDVLASDALGELRLANYAPHRRPVLFRRFIPALARPGPWELAASEIQAWARVDHPGVLQPIDWGNTGAGPFLATEVPAGDPLAVLLTEERGLRDRDPEVVFSSLAASVEAARRLGVLHLGLDLTNIWVSPAGSVQVSEFGLWYVGSVFPDLEIPLAPFAAPEQERDGPVGATADVFSIGLIGVALSSGLAAAREAASASSIPSGSDPVFAAAAARCLQPDPVARFRTAGEIPGGTPAGLVEDAEFRDCPICRLKRQIEADGRQRRPRRSHADEEHPAGAPRVPHDALVEHHDVPGRPRTVPPARAESRSRRRLDSVSPLERAARLDGGCSPGPDRGERVSGGDERAAGRQATSLAALFPWIVIAALALATLVVWWLAFR